jgi:hypothetical protein
MMYWVEGDKFHFLHIWLPIFCQVLFVTEDVKLFILFLF